MSNPARIAETWAIEQCNGKIGQWMSSILPEQQNFPNTKITLHVADTNRGPLRTVTFAVEIECSPEEFGRLILEGQQPKPYEPDKINHANRTVSFLLVAGGWPNPIVVTFARNTDSIMSTCCSWWRWGREPVSKRLHRDCEAATIGGTLAKEQDDAASPGEP